MAWGATTSESEIATCELIQRCVAQSSKAVFLHRCLGGTEVNMAAGATAVGTSGSGTASPLMARLEI
jgi:hypothetical protein